MKGWMMSMIERRGWMAKGTVENAYVETSVMKTKNTTRMTLKVDSVFHVHGTSWRAPRLDDRDYVEDTQHARLFHGELGRQVS
jgi:hypothetical protein